MRALAVMCLMMLAFSMAVGQTGEEYWLLVGTYSNADNSNGLQVYRFNTSTGDARFESKSTDVTNPSYLAVGKDGTRVFAVSEMGQGKGTVNSFSFNPSNGALSWIGSVTSAGDHPCYVSVSNDQKVVFAGNYSSGTLSAVRVSPDGTLDPKVQTIKHEGSSVNTSRQDKPHVHAVVLSPDGKYLMVPDLGTDKIHIYAIKTASDNPLEPVGAAPVTPGGGPRHLTFHPNGKYAYLIRELDAAVTVFDYKDGKLKEKQSITLLDAGFQGSVGAADIHVSPDGKFLYGSNRGEANEITIYSIGKDGKLTYVGRQSTLGRTPRNFAIDPTGNFLLAANQDTNDIVIFKRDQKTGLLQDTGKRIQLDKPVCLKFVRINTGG
ncbi:MAG TPA: lactonase family protein [Cyclobacteriaceae bacterium]